MFQRSWITCWRGLITTAMASWTTASSGIASDKKMATELRGGGELKDAKWKFSQWGIMYIHVSTLRVCGTLLTVPSFRQLLTQNFLEMTRNNVPKLRGVSTRNSDFVLSLTIAR